MKLMSSFQKFWSCCIAASLALGCAAGGPGPGQNPVPPGLSVSGHGEARGEPDIARVTIGVETRGRVAAEATAQANQLMAGVMAALTQGGVADADIRTQNFSINFEQEQEPHPPTPLPADVEGRKGSPGADLPKGFYRVSNQAEATVRQLDKLGGLLGAVTSAGANNIWGIQFEIENPAALEAEARKAAVAEAKARAEQLAALAGVKLGRLISLSTGASGEPMMRGGFAYGKVAQMADVPVQGGELTVSQDVHVVYAIE